MIPIVLDERRPNFNLCLCCSCGGRTSSMYIRYLQLQDEKSRHGEIGIKLDENITS